MQFKKIVFIATLALGFDVMAEKDTMIVFDASGSMWGQIEGKTKIEIAREAMSTIGQGFKAGQVVGLMAYGHRRKGDCSDIEHLVDPAADTADRIVAYVNELQPKGKTPLSQAVKLAAEKMKFTENAAEVVLITDGVETCDLDPCATAETLEKQGVDFTAHVIGFGLSDDQGKQVSCLADITGGRYVPANDAASLNQALEQVILAEETTVTDVQVPEATLTVPKEDVVIGADFTVDWTGPAGELDYIDVVNKGWEKVYGELTYAWAKDESPARLKAPGKAGEYDIRYVWHGPKSRQVLTRATINVVESNVSLVAPSQITAGESFSVDWTGPNRQDDYVDLVKKDDSRTFGELSYFYTKSGSPGQLQAPAEGGVYDIRYILEAPEGRKILYRTSVEVKPVDVSLAFQPTAKLAETFTVHWTGPNNKDGYIDLVKAGHKVTYGELSHFYLKNSPESGELMAPVEAGDYQVRFVMDGAGGRKVISSSPITIESTPATLNVPATAAAGSSIQIQWTGPNRQGDYIDLMQLNKNTLYGEIAYFYTKDNPEQGTLVMPEQPGEYKIRYIIQGQKRAVLAEQAITVQ